jgi:colanic acid biosynthesis glycosyl transferase WcaI
MARIAFLSLVFPPDSVSTAQIMGELALELRKLGHEVCVLTTTPHYNRDLEAEAKQPLDKYWYSIIRRSSYQGIPVYHVIMPKKGKGILQRLLPWLSFHVLSTLAGFVLIPKPDVLVVPSPPLTIGINAWLLCLLLKSKYIYNVQEIYPDVAISLGAIGNKTLVRMLYRIEALVYSKAAAVTVIAPHMAVRLLSKGVPASKVKVIPNFADIHDLRPMPKDNAFSRKYGIWDKFVVSYAGNMGPAQDLDTYISCALMLRDQPGIQFMMMGDGILRDELKQRVNDSNLSNFTFLDYQPYSLVPEIYASSDLCLVPQSRTVTSVAIPSKVYRIMACARPVLAATVPGSDLEGLINQAGCGMVVEPGSPQRLAEAIIAASTDSERLRSMGEAGRAHVVGNYAPYAVVRQYHDLIMSILEDPEGVNG